jgi:GMP synthase-like glutamine amidotransferase
MHTSSPPTIAVVDPAQHTPELACFNHISQATTLRATYHLPALHGFGTLADHPENYAGVIVLGSGASVYDGYPWQTQLHNWLQKMMAHGVPTLGICYGHQAIAHIYGGRIGLLYDGEKAKGTRDIRFQCDRLNVRDQTGKMVVSHREGITEMPDQFEIISTSSACPTDGIRHVNHPIWGVQPHIEAVPQFCLNNDISIASDTDTFQFGHLVLEAFLSFVSHRV